MTSAVVPSPGMLVGIPARSERQAMDWSLVLASQGIEVVIERVPEGQGWLLVVELRERERALSAIRQYRLENRRWAWRQTTDWPGLVFHWGVLLWCWLLMLFHWMGEAAPGLETAGILDSERVRAGEWWRLFTAVSLHADVGHLAANVSTGLIILGLAMARFGFGCTVLAAFLAGVGGNLVGLLFRSMPYHGLGASGMVMGGLGMLAVQSFWLLRGSREALRRVCVAASAGLMLFVLVGLNPASDVVAHAGGFTLGALLGVGVAFVPQDSTRFKRFDRSAAALAGALLALAWVCAGSRA